MKLTYLFTLLAILLTAGLASAQNTGNWSTDYALDESFLDTDVFIYEVSPYGAGSTKHTTWLGMKTALLPASSEILLDGIGSPTYQTLQQMQDVVHSTGWVTGGEVTDGGAGTVNVGAGGGLIRSADSEVAPLLFFDWIAETGQALTDASINYVYVEYNGGAPIVSASTADPAGDHTKVTLARVYRSGTSVQIFSGVRETIGDHAGLMMRSMSETMPFAHVSGAATTEPASLKLAVGAGVFWHGLTRITTSAINTNVADTFTYYYRNGAGGWTAVPAQTVIDDDGYDDNSGSIATLANNRYGVHWVYLSDQSDLSVVYGQADRSLTEAQDAAVPSGPPIVTVNSRLIAKIIVQKAATSFTSVESAFMSQFASAPIVIIEGTSVKSTGPVTDGYVLTADGAGAAAWEAKTTTTDLAGGTALTIGTNYFDTLISTSFSSYTTAVTFSGTPANGDTINFSFDSDGTYTLTIPTSYPLYSSGSTTSLTFPEGENTIKWWYEDGKWRVAASTITEESFSFPIVEPDLIQAVRDTVLLKKFPAELYPNGFTLTAAHIDVSASVTSNTHLIEIWASSVDGAPTLAESITLTAASTAEDDGTFSSAAVPADGWVAIDLDAATENMEELIVTIIGYAN